MDNRATTDRTPAPNSGLAKWRVTFFYDAFVVKKTVVLVMNFSAKNPPLRQAANRYKQAEKKRQRQDEKEFLLHKDKEVK